MPIKLKRQHFLKVKILSVSQDTGKVAPFYVAGGHVNWNSFLWSSVTECVKSLNKCSHPADLVIPLPGIFPEEIIRHVDRDLCKNANFDVILNWIQPSD